MTKKLAIGIAVLGYCGLAFIAAEYLAAAVFMILNKMSPEGLTTDTWWQYWSMYSSERGQRKRLQLSAAASALAMYGVPLGILYAALQARRSLHGDARFATPIEVRKAGLHAEEGIIVGRHNGRYLQLGGQQFVLLAAPTRSGKGVGVVIPNLLNFSGSVVVLDIKLENFRLTSEFRAKHGQSVYLFSPFNEDGLTHRWNPLDNINRDANQRVGDAMAIGQVLYPNDRQRDSFWNDQARNLFLGLTLYLMETPALPCTLGELLRQSSGKGRSFKDHVQDILVARTHGPEALSDTCLDALNRVVSTSENTLASILATFTAPLTVFANPVVDAATAGTDFQLSEVRKRRMSIYIGIPANRLADAALLVNLLFSQLVNLNTRELPQDNPTLKHQCLLVLDEFAALGRVEILANAVSFISGYNLRLLPIVQSIAQLEDVYGEKAAQTFVTNHAAQILYPPREQRDANAYSEMLGYLTATAVSKGVSLPRAWGAGGRGSTSENSSEQRRALLLPQEVKELGDGSQILVFEGCKPILCDKARYYSDPVFMNRLKRISPTLKAVRGLPAKAQIEDAAFVKLELSAPVPTLDLTLHRLRVEQRVRAMEADEPIDIERLAMDVADLPAISDQVNPSPAEIAATVDHFFGKLAWASETTEQDDESNAESSHTNEDVGEMSPTASDDDLLDLSVLDSDELSELCNVQVDQEAT